MVTLPVCRLRGMQRQINIIIPMAGDGARFAREGYVLPKFKIPVRGRSLFHWALLSLRNFIRTGSHVIFVARPEHEPDEFISAECKTLGIGDFSILHALGPTDGQ